MAVKNNLRFPALILSIIMLMFASACTREESVTEESYPLTVSFVDVGQGDGILIECDDNVIAIDGGEKNNAYMFVSYLKERNVDKIDYYIATHPHSDHIGAIPSVLSQFDVDTFIMNTFSEMNIPTTKTYENMLNALDGEECEVICPAVGDVLTLGEMTLTFFAPVEETDDYNNMSLVFKLKYGSTSFLFAGDAEKTSENLILDTGADLDADVLKVGHHGSSSSTGAAFLDAVSPEIAVISCGKDNEYGHPHDETTEILENYGCDVFRTDTDGTVVICSDGNKITVG